MTHHAQLITMRTGSPANVLAPVEPRVPLSIRLATMADVPFMDRLQKLHSKQLGYFPTKQFEGYVAMGGVLVAESIAQSPDREGGVAGAEAFPEPLPYGRGSERTPLGYVISRDRYLKRDELGVVYQLCVLPGDRRKLVGAALLKAVFERSAYGCRLYGCWCAQDLAANHFWESMGFVPLAFRAGSAKKKGVVGGEGRVHIYWQKRITEGDDVTPLWYPFQTNSGAIRQDRLVFPIPPGTHWSEVRAVAVPTVGRGPSDGAPDEPRTSVRGPVKTPRRKAPPTTPPAPKLQKIPIWIGGKIKYITPPTNMNRIVPRPAPPEVTATVETTAIVAKKLMPAPAAIDPAFLTANRELRDRYLERLNADASLLPASPRYAMARALPRASGAEPTVPGMEARVIESRRLPAAA